MMDKSYQGYRLSDSVGRAGASRTQRAVWKFSAFLTMLAMFCFLGSQSAFAQGGNVTGKVTDAAGSGLPGVTVQLKGSPRGTTTDGEGVYRLQNVPSGSTLVFSSIGFTTQEVAVGSRTTVDLSLIDDSKALEEVVVVGYGTAKRKDLTGAVTQITARDLNPGVNPNPLQAIQGKVAGLVITTPSGDPNANPTVRLRGYTSLSGAGDPLYVVDGVIGVPIQTISPQDIESMDVLKDASAAAIYGSRGANGVIIITTKRGKSGKTTVTFNNYVGIQTVARRLDLLDGPGYVAAVTQIEGAAALGDLQRFTKDASGNFFNTDWFSQVTRNAAVNNHDLAVSGGSQAFSYRGSLSYIDQQGLVKKTGFDRVTARINLDQKAFDNRLNIQYNLAYTENNRELDNRGPVAAATFFLPTMPVVSPTAANNQGGYAEVGGSFDLFNPVAILENQINTQRQGYLQGGMNLRYEILDGLTLGVNGQLQRDNRVTNFASNAAIKAFAGANGQAGRGLEQNSTKLMELTANYTKEFGTGNNYSLLGGYSYQQFDYDGFSAQNNGFVTPDINFNNLGLGSGSLVNPSSDYARSYRNQNKLISFFGRATVNFGDRYNVTASLRRDGNSVFGANNKWGLFPSAAAGWTISNENFFPKSGPLNYLKLRVGYGSTGNSENIFPYNSLQLYGQSGTYFDGTLNNFLPGYGIIQNANPNLKWEVVTTTNLGLDFQLFKNRLNGTIEVYDKVAKDMLYNFSVPADGIRYFTNSILANVGSMRNRGIELSLGGDIIDKGDFNWNARIVGNYNQNRILSLSNDEFTVGQIRFNFFGGRGLSNVAASVLTVGRPLGEFNSIPTFAGFVDETKDGKVNTLMGFVPATGTTPATTFDKSDAAKALEDGNPISHGNPQPFLNASFINSFRYKNFDLSFMLRGTFGNKILNNTRANSSIPGSILQSNQLTSVTDLPRTYGTNALSTYWLEDGTFVRLDNWQIGYNVPVPANKFISNARVYLGGNNLFLITNYSGIDPELEIEGRVRGRSQSPSNIGLDNRGIFPRARTFQLGVNLTF
ncbi:MAG: TonB-dependent receptor [Cytophagales bacterium]|nr:MAG: TonB-dependent receptor [Cytophagales bacterium]